MAWSSATFTSTRAAVYFSCVDGIVAIMSIKEGEGFRSSSQERGKAFQALRAEFASPGFSRLRVTVPSPQTLETPSKSPLQELEPP